MFLSMPMWRRNVTRLDNCLWAKNSLNKYSVELRPSDVSHKDDHINNARAKCDLDEGGKDQEKR